MGRAVNLTPLVERFPHLEPDIRGLAKTDSSFVQLCDEYRLLIRSIEDVDQEANGDRKELQELKAVLELEALELLSQLHGRKRGRKNR